MCVEYMQNVFCRHIKTRFLLYPRGGYANVIMLIKVIVSVLDIVISA